MNALIILDLQNDFTPGGSLAIEKGDTIIQVVNSLQDHFDLVVATQDWHPGNHRSFASNNPGKNPFDTIEINGLSDTLWPDHCVQGSAGADFHPGLKTKNIAAIFRKGMDPGTDSYSGFYDNDHKTSTGLAGYLKAKNVKEVFFCGLAGDICVYYSVKDSVKEGFDTTLIEDAAMPLNMQNYTILKKELSEMGVSIIKSEKILNKSK
ncbi:MAG TPA: bifunctional nicotinamidase/pyrazinamidase [Bacteroidales bacterium]|nr:bifunctional nicotinamidase/pyrazinamidase [Bacteroidales bacterium]